MYVKVYFDHGDRTRAPTSGIINRPRGQSSPLHRGPCAAALNNAGGELAHASVMMLFATRGHI